MGLSAAQLHDWANKTLFEINVKSLDINSILNMSAESLNAKSFEEVHNIITQLAQYNLFLTNELNIAKASYRYYDKEYKERLAKISAVCAVEGKSKEEREYNACNKDDGLRKLNDKKEESKVKIERLDGMPFIVNTYLAIVQQIFKMKSYEKHNAV